MSERLIKKVLSISMLIAIGPQAFAENLSQNPYSFRGLCQSQGAYTASALSQTARIREVLTALKDNPKCKPFSQRAGSILTSIDAQQTIADSKISMGGEIDKLTSNPPGSRATEMVDLQKSKSDLMSFIKGPANASSKGEAMKLLLNSMVRPGIVDSLEVAKGAVPGLNEIEAIRRLAERTDRTIGTSLTMFNQLVDTFPDAMECLDGDAPMGTFIAGSIKLAASFANDNGPRNGQLAQAVAKLTRYLRDRKYAKALRNLNQVEFTTSMSCLMEIAAENYCSIKDGQALLKQTMDELKVDEAYLGKPGKSGRLAVNNLGPNKPLSGMAVAAFHLPNINNWLLSVQFGVIPPTTDDADRKNLQLDNITNFFKNVNNNLGSINQWKMDIAAITDMNSKRSFLLKKAIKLATDIQGGFGASSKTENFFTSAWTEQEIPYKLVGFETIPEDAYIVSPTGGKSISDPDVYFNAHAATIFGDPMAKVDDIGAQFQKLVSIAQQAAIQSYNRWMISDGDQVMLEAVTSAPYSILQSLRFTNDYLAAARARILQRNCAVAKKQGKRCTRESLIAEDGIIVDSIEDTRARISSVLAGFAAVSHLNPNLSMDDRAEMIKGVVNLTYKQFNILLSRSGFLQNRVSRIIFYDYVKTLATDPKVTSYQRVIAAMAFQDTLNRMVSMAGANPANLNTDLGIAEGIAVDNIKAIRDVFDSPWQAAIARAKLAQNGGVSGIDMTLNSMGRAIRNPFIPYSVRGAGRIDQQDWFPKWLKPVYRGAVDILSAPKVLRLTWNTEKYPIDLSFYRADRVSPDNARLIYSLFCAQALAFSTWRDYVPLCNGADLMPTFVNRDALVKTMGPQQSLLYRVNFMQKSQQGSDNPRFASGKSAIDAAYPERENVYNRICALRDYHRNNAIMTKIMYSRQMEDSSAL